MAFAAYFKHTAPIKMFFTERLESEICYTSEESHVRKNCNRLGISLDGIEEMPRAIDIYRYNYFVICIYKEAGKLSQYVFPTSANKRAVEKIIKNFPQKAAKCIMKAGEFSDWNYTFI